MQTLEATLSLIALLSLSVFLQISSSQKLDSSLYLYELAGDAKNVMHIMGGFENKTRGNEIASAILDESGLCIEFESTEITSSLVSDGGISSPAFVPKFGILHLNVNGTWILLPNLNLTGFEYDKMHLGACR